MSEPNSHWLDVLTPDEERQFWHDVRSSYPEPITETIETNESSDIESLHTGGAILV